MIQPLSVSCPNECSDHGHCVSQACVCSIGWTGEACNVSLCRDNCNEASQRGVCNASHVCECAEGYGGRFCEQTLCSTNCSEPHGYCDTSKGVCRCAPGFGGSDCSKKESKALHECSGHGGIGTDGTCKCEDAWMGFLCEQRRCPDDCSGYGLCANGTCICDNGYEGKNCAYGSATSNYKHHCDRRCAVACIPRCKHVSDTADMYFNYPHLDNHTGMLDPPPDNFIATQMERGVAHHDEDY